ncbi:MAG: hypothetical protein H7842_12035, partial [Gammaproteobacteria bacterium SHHR-1]
MPVSDLSQIDRFSLSLLLALLLHGMLLLVHFEFEPGPAQHLQRALEITLVRHPRPPEENPEADFLAQTSQLGAGEQMQKKPPKTRQIPPAQRPQEQPPQP